MIRITRMSKSRFLTIRIVMGKVVFQVAFVWDGLVGRSIEFDLWVGRQFAYLSIGKRYSGRFWVRRGGY